MLVTLLGRVMSARLVHSLKQFHPKLVTVSGIVTAVRLAQPLKQSSPMLVTPSEITTLVSFGQSRKAPPSKFCMLLGIVMLVIPELLKHPPPKLVTLSGILTVLRLVQR